MSNEPRQPLAPAPALPVQSGLKPDRPLRVCIASHDFVGPVRNGGVGTAFTSLGEALAAAGHEVTLLFLAGNWCENKTLDHWIQYYAKKNIRFVPMPESGLRLDTHWYLAKAYEAYLWLKRQQFDVIHFSEWKGPGFYTLQAKRQGLAFDKTLLCVHTHGPTLWHKLSNAEYVTQPLDLETDYMERTSTRLAEVLASPSQYLLRWMNEQGYQVPAETFVQPYVRPATARKPVADADRVHRINEFVFFGRLEVRKGLVLFCDALDQLKNDPRLRTVTITFLGKVDKIGERSSADYLADRAKSWPWKWQIICDRDQAGAMDYLQGQGRLALLPSLVDNLPNTVLECLGAKIPFLASDAGGIPEMIAADDLAATCFPLRARAFAERLRQVVAAGLRPARPAVDPQGNEIAWVQWHENRLHAMLTAPAAPAVPAKPLPLVSVCMSHWNRPHYLRQSLASIEKLDYPNFELVLVDDGSTQPEAIQLIEELTPKFAAKNWQLIRNPENKYPGAARNIAARHARGEYVMFMDDDNCAKPHELSTFVNVALRTGADMLTCCLDMFSGDAAPEDGLAPKARWVFLGDAAAAGAIRNCFGDTNSLIRREVFLALGGFHEDWGVGHEDWELFAKAVLKGYKLEVIPEALAWYRLNDTEQTVNRKTPLHANHMANIRPYLDAVPPELRQLVLLAQGQSMAKTNEGLKLDNAYAKASIAWKTKFEAGRTLVVLSHAKAGVRLMLDALKVAETSNVPLAILEALLEVGAELRSLDPSNARQTLQLAKKLAEALRIPAQTLQAQRLLDEMSGKSGSQGEARTKPGLDRVSPHQGSPKESINPPIHQSTFSPRVSIVIPTFNKLEFTRRCLESIAQHTPAGLCEIIVVDNGSTDGTVEFLKSEEAAGRLRALINGKNLGFAKACNLGAKAARGRWLLLLNNDTEARPNWIEPLLRTAEQDPRVGAVGSKLLFPDGTLQHAGVVLLNDEPHDDPLLARHVFHGERGDLPDANRPMIYRALTAACLLVDLPLFLEIGGFDEEFYNGYEDVDLCFRIQAANRLLVYQPESVLTHFESQSGPERFRQARQNIARLHGKWLKSAEADYSINAVGKVARSPKCRIAAYTAPAAAANDRCAASIIILALNQAADTRLCLESIAANTPLPHELILVDNGSTDGIPALFREWQSRHPRCKVIRNKSNRGFAAGNNQGLSIARGDNVVLLNNDTVLTAGWLEGMLHVLESHPDTGVVGPVSNRVSGPQLVTEIGYQDLSGLPAFAAEWFAKCRGQSFEINRAVGFCLLAKRAVIEAIGGLDEQFGSGNFEDDDFCIRARLAGYKIRIAKDVFIHHTGSQTFKGARIDYQQAMQRNWKLFRTKWHLPPDVTLERGYPVPAQLPQGTALKLPLPSLSLSHQEASPGTWEEARRASSAPAAAPLNAPPVASLGSLDEARACFGRREFARAWELSSAALQVRPFHPDAWLLLAEIALAGGDSNSARQCAHQARDLVPGWKAVKQFLQKPLKGNTRPDWLKIPTPPAAPRLTVCVITKNEEKFIEACLKSVRPIADQIVVVDTGSTDRTVEIAKSIGAEVHAFAWCDDFSAARNAALQHARGNWVLMLDADEELPAAEHAHLKSDLKQAQSMGLRLPLVNAGQESEGRSFVPRLFRNAPGLFYQGRIHEQLFPSLLPLCKAWSLDTRLGTAQILHHGYSKELVADRNKIERNLALLKKALGEQPDDANLVMNLGLETVRSGDLKTGVGYYLQAFRLLSLQPPADVVPELREVLLTQLTCHLYKGCAHEEVVNALTSPLAKNGGLTASLHYALGLAYFELGRYSDSAEEMRHCLTTRGKPALSPINTDILTAAPHHCLAISLSKLGDVDGAEKAFQAAFKEPGRQDEIRVDYARFLAGQGRALDAFQQLHGIVSRNAGHAAAWRCGGELALSKPEFLDFAVDWTGEAIKFLPEDPVIVAQRAEVLLLRQDIAGAKPLWERACNGTRPPRALAAVILCSAAESGSAPATRDNAEEIATSRAFLEWYQRLVNAGANDTVLKLNSRVDAFRGSLPTAAQLLDSALAEAAKAA